MRIEASSSKPALSEVGESAIGNCWAGTLKSILLDSALSWVQVHLKASAVICQPYTEGQELLHQGAEKARLGFLI